MFVVRGVSIANKGEEVQMRTPNILLQKSFKFFRKLWFVLSAQTKKGRGLRQCGKDEGVDLVPT